MGLCALSGCFFDYRHSLAEPGLVRAKRWRLDDVSPFASSLAVGCPQFLVFGALHTLIGCGTRRHGDHRRATPILWTSSLYIPTPSVYGSLHERKPQGLHAVRSAFESPTGCPTSILVRELRPLRRRGTIQPSIAKNMIRALALRGFPGFGWGFFFAGPGNHLGWSLPEALQNFYEVTHRRFDSLIIRGFHPSRSPLLRWRLNRCATKASNSDAIVNPSRTSTSAPSYIPIILCNSGSLTDEMTSRSNFSLRSKISAKWGGADAAS